MKCDKLKPLLYSIRDLAYVDEPQPEPHFQNPHDHAVYKATEVDAAIDELKTEHHKERDEYIIMVHQKDKEIAELKAKLEDAKATAYAESVDAGMRERRLKRALYKACENWADAEVFSRVKSVNDDNTEANKWAVMRNKCRAMAEKYK